jgi:hypothetical protein
MAQSPLRNVGVTTPCPVCGAPFTPVGRQRVCSAACRQAAWRSRHAVPLASIPSRASRAATIYECPSCDTRYLGEQRCPECAIFCRKLGPGALCPHCDEPVLLADLVLGMEGGEAPHP